jgi:hypothetical protein
MNVEQISLFEKIICNVKPVILKNDEIFVLVNFNEKTTLLDYRFYLEGLNNMALIQYQELFNEDLTMVCFYHNNLYNRLVDEYNRYEFIDGMILYKNLVIINCKDNTLLTWQELDDPLRTIISDFLTINMNILIDFISHIEPPSEFQEAVLRYYGLKVEESSVLSTVVNDPPPSDAGSPDSANIQWLDTEEVCFMLKCSKRTLQRYRKMKILSYSVNRNKIYYKLIDINNLLNSKYK